MFEIVIDLKITKLPINPGGPSNPGMPGNPSTPGVPGKPAISLQICIKLGMINAFFSLNQNLLNTTDIYCVCLNYNH